LTNAVAVSLLLATLLATELAERNHITLWWSTTFITMQLGLLLGCTFYS